MRTERCCCGGIIVAPSLRAAAPYVEGHNATPLHTLWRHRNEPCLLGRHDQEWCEAEKLNGRPTTYRDPRPTAGPLS